MSKKMGFTLAEVLITLGIIGVVAAMTIPTLMNQTSQAEFKTGFKKIISTLNQAITMNVALDDSDFHVLSASTTANTSIYGMFTARMNTIAVDTTASTNTSIDPSGVSALLKATDNYAIFFNDGMVLAWPSTSAACTDIVPCDAIVDVNGGKKPNRLTNCAAASITATSEAATTCTSTSAMIGDRFSIRFGAQGVYPNGPGARYVMYN